MLSPYNEKQSKDVYFLPLLFNVAQKILTHVIKQEKQ